MGRDRFGAVTVETKAGQHDIAVKVFLEGASPDLFRVELYAMRSRAVPRLDRK